MPKQLLAMVIVLWLLVMGSFSAGAESPLEIRLPVEGTTVSAPVGVDIGYFPGATDGFRLSLEVASGTGATEGFHSVTHSRATPGPGGRVTGPLIYWDAHGVSGGPYTIRVTARHRETEAVLARGVRSIFLEASDHSPVVVFNPPDGATGTVRLAGSVQDSDLQGWKVDLIDGGGIAVPLGTGEASGLVAVSWESAAVPDGTYTLQLSATDTAGNVTEATQTLSVTNPPPKLTVSETTVEAGPVELPVRYTTGSPVHLTVTLRSPTSGEEIVRVTANGETGTEMDLAVPIHLAELAPGPYTAVVLARDAGGRIGTAEFAVQVLAPVQPPTVAELPPVTGDAVVLNWSVPIASARSGFAILRTGSDGTEVMAELGPEVNAYIDRPRLPGQYTYRVVMVTPDGRWIEGPSRSTLVDRTPPILTGVSISPVDGVGLHMRWLAASDPAGIVGYRVLMTEADGRRTLADLPPSARMLALPLSPGHYRAVLVAIDGAGNAGESGQLAFRVEPGAVALLSHDRFAPADVPGFIQEGRTWVPLRFFAEALGYQVLYDAERRVASVADSRSGRLVMAAVEQSELLLEGGDSELMQLPAPPRLVGGRMLVPLRAFAEAMGARVTWEPATRTVVIAAD